MTIAKRSIMPNLQVRGVILDWAGTAVDYGCLGPTAVFVEAFKYFSIDIDISQARRFMGLAKKDHVRSILQLPEISAKWMKRYGKQPTEEDVEMVYAETEPRMLSTIADHCQLIDGLIDFVDGVRKMRIKIGSSTGYTRSMMEVVMPIATDQGYQPDAIVCSSDVPAGRPLPWMCYLNAIHLQVYPMAAMVKIGDTLSDIEEGRNAGMWTIGLTRSGNELGLSRQETEAMHPDLLGERLQAIEKTYRATGAHYVAAGIWECLPIIKEINQRLADGDTPDGKQQ